MAFIDEMEVHIKAGKGGNGVVRWLHEYAKEFGGPSGGDGGRGGDVYVRAIADTFVLRKYMHTKEFFAEAGDYGSGNSSKGKQGDDFIIDLPVGSIVTRIQDINIHDNFSITNPVIELDTVGQTVRILKGGSGGYGNEHFKGPANQKPEEWTAGKPGEEGQFHIEVRMIADIGLIGLPNAGKSSLLNALTKADVKVGNYEFTTLEPNLGSMYGTIIADIPGLIEGASEGKGLGHTFLRHIQRTKILAHCVSLEQTVEQMIDVYKVIRKELEQYSLELSEKKEVIILTKTDTCTPEEVEEKKKAFAKKLKLVESDIQTISVYDLDATKVLREWFTNLVA
ncbi:MAG: GTPase ObgE [Patescibacteria group bacterium]